jgi:hypothetical protein
MYKIDSQTLKKITKFLDIAASRTIGMSDTEEKQVRKLSKHIKNNYTQIKPQ